LVAPPQGLRIPRVDDCIALFLGSRAAYREAFQRRSGSYYLTPGWVAENRDPLGTLETDYVPRVGREDAEWALREEFKHYTHIVAIFSATSEADSLRARVRENAGFLDKAYEEVQGNLDYFVRVLVGPYDDDWFVTVEPGARVSQASFLD
ncbi:MAG: DUF1638 domain-containing protein, partial [Thermoleophilia bacterium]|nr:DUF1638 domain-containing protein [Thermoleophilia bacterium]